MSTHPRHLVRYVAAALAVLALTTVLVPPPVAAQDASAGDTELVTEAMTLRYRKAVQAVELVHPLLSARGTVELQPGGNTIVLRDVRQAIDRIVPLLEEFDRPANLVTVRVQIVSAGSEPVGLQTGPTLPAGMLARLRGLLRYESYSLLAVSEFAVQEGLAAASELSGDYRVDFRLGRLLEDRRISLEGFKISRRGDDGEMGSLIHTNLNLNLGRPMVLGLAKSESSDRALMVIVECRQGEMLLTER